MAKKSTKKSGKAEAGTGGAGTGTAVMELPKGEPRAMGDTVEVEISTLEFDDQADRLDELLDEQRITELAATMGRSGQLHPIGITGLGASPRHERVVFGRRRVLAAKRLGWKTIRAVRLELASEAELHEAREVENFQRQDLALVEESAAVARMLDLEAANWLARNGHPTPDKWSWADLAPSVRSEILRAVATKLGKSETWIRDRAFLARLSGKARELVLKGLLPLGHAREISKLADPTLRDEIAERAAIRTTGDHWSRREHPMPMDELRAWVSRHLFSLAQVPWKLEVPFAGGPACVDCPHNSANQPGLFEHGGRFCTDPKEGKSQGRLAQGSGTKEPQAGVCTNHPCYSRKSAAANRAVSTSASKAVREAKAQPKAKRPAMTPTYVAQFTPEFLEPSKVATQAKAKISEKGTGGKKDQKSTLPGGFRNNPREEAVWAWEKACRDAVKTIEPKIAAKLQETPGAWAIYHLIRGSKPYQATRDYNKQKAAKAVASPAMRSLLKLLGEAPSLESVIRIEKECGRKYGLLDDWYDGPSGIAHALAQALGIECDPQPKLEDFLPKKDAAPAPAATAGDDDGPAAREKKARARKKSRPALEIDDDMVVDDGAITGTGPDDDEAEDEE